VILNCLSTYLRWSSLCINRGKCRIFFSKNCRTACKNNIIGILQLPFISPRAKYLGIPLFMSRKKIVVFMEIKDKILAKIYGWKARLLSQAARSTLLKSVANAIPTYTMSLFLLHKSMCFAINAVPRKFLVGFSPR
jgi:hypothetical protein